MVCTKCGATLPDDTLFCAQCGTSMQANQSNQTDDAQPPIPTQYAYNNAQQAPAGQPTINGTTYLIFAIIATVICCLPFGIPAIIFATKIDKAQAMGDFAGAAQAAKKSKMWSIIAAASMAVFMVLYVILVVVIGVSAFGTTSMY